MVYVYRVVLPATTDLHKYNLKNLRENFENVIYLCICQVTLPCIIRTRETKQEWKDNTLSSYYTNIKHCMYVSYVRQLSWWRERRGGKPFVIRTRTSLTADILVVIGKSKYNGNKFLLAAFHPLPYNWTRRQHTNTYTRSAPSLPNVSYFKVHNLHVYTYTQFHICRTYSNAV